MEIGWPIVLFLVLAAAGVIAVVLLKRRDRDGERAGAGERSTWEEREIDAVLAEDSAPGGAPRRQHYDFAHLLLRQRFVSDPAGLLRLLSGEDGATLLQALWNEAGQSAGEIGVESIPAGGLERVVETWTGGGLLIVRLPTPQAMTEAHLLALVVPEADAARYFTLEHGFDSEGDPRTVLCEWRAGAHYNYGDGPEPDVEAFAAAVRARLDPPEAGN